MTSKDKRHIAVDLDGVLAQYDGQFDPMKIGDPIPGAHEFLEDCMTSGMLPVIHTTRAGGQASNADGETEAYQFLIAWLDRHGFVKGVHYDYVWFGVGKPIAAAYIDDRAVSCRPQEDGRHAYAAAHDTAFNLCYS